MLRCKIEFDSDNDFDVYGPGGYFSAMGPEFEYSFDTEDEESARREIVWILSRVEIRRPYEKEYSEYSEGNHDSEFKRSIYEIMHRIATGEPLNCARGGNRSITISVDPLLTKISKKS